MEFFIKKHASLPLLKMQVVKDGRSDYNNMMDLIEQSAIFFSMVDVETGVPKITTRPAGIVAKTMLDPNAEPEYYVYYQFRKFDTRKVGRFEGQFIFLSSDGTLILPIREKLFINVQESFISDDLEPGDGCYETGFPCCATTKKPIPPTPTPCPTCPPCPPITTTTTTEAPVTTTTTTEAPVTTTTTTNTPLTVILDVDIAPGSIVINYNLTSNQTYGEEISMSFTHNLGTTGSPITIMTGVTIPIGQITGNTEVIINEDFNILTKIDSFGDFVVYPPNLYFEVYENYPTPTPTATPTPTPTNTPLPPTCIDTWATENFSGTTYRNGDPIPQATNSGEWTDATTNQTGAWCYYNFDTNNGPIYGKLYNWYVVGDPRGIGPNGYIVPSEDDYTSLENCLGGNSIAGGKMKTTGTTEDNTGLWNSPNAGATNESGFSGKPSGVMTDGGSSTNINIRGSFWTNTEIGGGSVMVMNLNNGRTDVYHGPDSKGKGYSIRLKQGIVPTPTPTPTSSPTPTPTPTPSPTPQIMLINPILVDQDTYLKIGVNEYLKYT